MIAENDVDPGGSIVNSSTLCAATAAVMALLIAACAPISSGECARKSAYDIGYSAAMDNADREGRYTRVSKICMKQERAVERQEYLDGFAAGTADFCQPGKGYSWGRRGLGYNGICANPEFDVAYQDGLREFKAEKRGDQIRARLAAIRDRLSVIADVLANGSDLDDTSRRNLVAEEGRLLMERRDLLEEKRLLIPR